MLSKICEHHALALKAAAGVAELGNEHPPIGQFHLIDITDTAAAQGMAGNRFGAGNVLDEGGGLRVHSKMTFTDIGEQAVGGDFNHIEDFVEAARSAIVGVGHLALSDAGREL